MTSASITATSALPSTPATRTSADSLKSVPSSLRSEWIKMSTLRSQKAILALTMTVNGFISFAIAKWVTDDITGEAITVLGSVGFATMFTAVFAAVGALLLFTAEAQHGTLAGTLTAQPSRWVVAGAKTIAAAGFGAGLVTAGLAAGFAGGLLSGAEIGSGDGVLSYLKWAVGFTALASVLGLGIGMIIRHGAAAISGLLVWWLIVENMLLALLGQQYHRFLPFSAGNGMLGVSFSDPGSSLALSRTVNAAVFAGYGLASVAFGTLLLHRRDLSS